MGISTPYHNLLVSDDELLSTISEHTVLLKSAIWLRNIRYNQKHYGFENTLKGLNLQYSGRKALVLGAGPMFKRFGMDDLSKVLTSNPVTVACDGALTTLVSLGYAPTFCSSVDAHPVVANFYRRGLGMGGGKIQGMTALLSTTVHPDVVNECLKYNVPIRWWQPFMKDGDGINGGELNRFYVDGVSSVSTGGNIGSTSVVIASMVLQCTPIGIMGLEFAWSDDTPMTDVQFFDQIMKIAGGDTEKAMRLFKQVKGPRDGRMYVVDPTYYTYLLEFRNLWKMIPPDVRKNIYNLTKEGILSAKGLRTITVEEFIGL